jgi:hypothetical protein
LRYRTPGSRLSTSGLPDIVSSASASFATTPLRLYVFCQLFCLRYGIASLTSIWSVIRFIRLPNKASAFYFCHPHKVSNTARRCIYYTSRYPRGHSLHSLLSGFCLSLLSIQVRQIPKARSEDLADTPSNRQLTPGVRTQPRPLATRSQEHRPWQFSITRPPHYVYFKSPPTRLGTDLVRSPHAVHTTKFFPLNTLALQIRLPLRTLNRVHTAADECTFLSLGSATLRAKTRTSP